MNMFIYRRLAKLHKLLKENKNQLKNRVKNEGLCEININEKDIQKFHKSSIHVH